MKNISVLFTPGIDSLCTKKHLDVFNKLDNIKYIYYDIKSKYSSIEIKYLKKYYPETIIDKSFNFSDIEQPSAYVPNRNLLLLMHCAGKYECDDLIISGSKSDRVSDNNEDICDSLSQIISKSLNKTISVYSLYWDKYKEDMVDEFLKLNNDDIKSYHNILINQTFSCYHPKNIFDKNIISTNIVSDLKYKHNKYECLNCNACFRKNVILYHAGVFRTFFNNDILEKYENEFKQTIIEDENNKRAQNSLNYILKFKSV